MDPFGVCSSHREKAAGMVLWLEPGLEAPRSRYGASTVICNALCQYSAPTGGLCQLSPALTLVVSVKPICVGLSKVGAKVLEAADGRTPAREYASFRS
jgi:hypothetical protein